MQFKHMEQQQEEFRSIPGYEGLYEVSNFGNVKSLGNNRTRKEKILKPVLVGLIGWQYYSVTLCKDGKSRHLNIHILVVMAFLGHVPDGTLKIVVDHIDNNRLNNHVSNLQLITQRENLSNKYLLNVQTFYFCGCWGSGCEFLDICESWGIKTVTFSTVRYQFIYISLTVGAPVTT